MNSISAENFMRSAKAPQISAGVMMAKVIWKHMKTDSGIVPLSVADAHAVQQEPVHAADIGVACDPPSVKASE